MSTKSRKPISSDAASQSSAAIVEARRFPERQGPSLLVLEWPWFPLLDLLEPRSARCSAIRLLEDSRSVGC